MDARALVKKLEKTLGGGVSVMGDGLFGAEPKGFFSTGIPPLDWQIGGGFPRGRVSEVYGDVATGKSVILLTAMGLAQQQGAICGLFDTERASTLNFAKKLAKLDPDSVAHFEPKSQQDLWNGVLRFVKAVREEDDTSPIFIGADSLAGVGPREEIEAGFDDEARMARAAQLIRAGFRILTGDYADKDVTLVFTNQEIFKIGAPAFAEKTQSWGGTAPKYFSSVRLKLDQIGWEKEENERVGAKIKATVVKNRFNPPGAQIEYTIWNRGPLAGLDPVGAVFQYVYVRHGLGSTKGFVHWAGTKYRPSQFLAMMRADRSLYAAVTKAAYEVFEAVGAGTPLPDPEEAGVE